MVILQHLMIIGITPEQLEEIFLSRQKIYDLGDIGITEKRRRTITFPICAEFLKRST
ncbi:MAG: hypothetical protein J1F28_05650 [Oscillospiraceae bacterium]|nr:hypothetical protein [Oscillospiraceae bacterium]